MEAVELTEEKFKKWKRKRLTTFFGYYISGLVFLLIYLELRVFYT